MGAQAQPVADLPPPCKRKRDTGIRRSGEENRRMPRLATFYGIVIWMYRPDHPPPHFHAQYGDEVAQIELATL
jgi:hypothetical protein